MTAAGRQPPAHAAPAFDVLTIGRVSVDLYPADSGVPLAEVHSFHRFLGGGPTNVAVAAARYGRRAAVITKVGAEGFGPYVHAALRSFGVDDRYVGTHPELLTPIVFCELYPPNHFPLIFYRAPKAPDLDIVIYDVDLGAVAKAGVFWTTGTGLCEEPSRSTTLAALEARGRRPHTVHDLDWRPMFWDSEEEARRWNLEALTRATAAVGNRAEVALVVGEGDPGDQARRLLELGVEIAFLKLGPEGTLVARKERIARVEALRVAVVNGLGAGDAFGGAVCHGLLADWEPERIARFANAAGALVATRLACADAMPSEAEVLELLSRSSGNASADPGEDQRHG